MEYDPLNCLRGGTGYVGVRGHDPLGKQGGRGDDLHRRTRGDLRGEREVVVAVVVRDGEDVAGGRLDHHHGTVGMLLDGGPGGRFGVGIDGGVEVGDVIGRGKDCLAVGYQLAFGGLDLDVEAGRAATGRGLLLEEVSDVGEAGVAVRAELVAAGVVDEADLRGDLDGGQVLGGGEVRRQNGGRAGDVPERGVQLLVGGQRRMVGPGAVQGGGRVARGYGGAELVRDRLVDGVDG